MISTSTQMRRRLRALLAVGAVVGTGSVAACKDFLAVENPAAVPVERLSDTSLVELMANSAIAGLQGSNFFWFSYLGAIFTDELRNHHVFFEEGLYDQRRVTVDNSYNSVFTYGPLMRARWLADSVAGRMRAIYGDSARRDARLARTYAIAGYLLVELAEGFCEVPIPSSGERYSAPILSDSVFALAITRFDSAVVIAASSKAANEAAGSAGQRYALAADSIRNLAYVGMARAALGRGDFAAAAAAAGQVSGMGSSADFEYRVYYNASTALGLSNLWAERLAGGAGVTAASVSGTPFLDLDDVRVPHPIDEATGDPLTEPTMSGFWVVPNSPSSFSTYNGTPIGADPSYGASVRLASLLEARYIIAEAEGATAENIAFIESRRTAFPSSSATTPTDATSFLDNLIDQRRRDFFLDGHRLGDLRRYEREYGREYWPTGSFYGSTTVSFGDGKCWPMNTAEITNNPLVPKPYTPPQGP